MRNTKAQDELLPSVLDRLIDPSSGGTGWRRGYSETQMIAAVYRDLEELLNTRQSYTRLLDEFPEVQNSLLAYGLPDLTSFNAITDEQRREIGRVLEAVIARFEPRLKDVCAEVEKAEGTPQLQRTVRFHIKARLCVDPAPAVAFDTILELTTGHYTVTPLEGKT
jgi:type VI secretion system protein ImpF